MAMQVEFQKAADLPKRIRTGLFTAQGGLPEGVYQQGQIQMLFPQVKDGRKYDYKVAISSRIKFKDKPEKHKDYFSIGLESIVLQKSILLSLILATREFAKYKHGSQEVKEFYRWLERLPKALKNGRFDDRIHVYGFHKAQL